MSPCCNYVVFMIRLNIWAFCMKNFSKIKEKMVKKNLKEKLKYSFEKYFSVAFIPLQVLHQL